MQTLWARVIQRLQAVSPVWQNLLGIPKNGVEKGQQKKAKQQKIIVCCMELVLTSIFFFTDFFYLYEEQDVVLGYSLNISFLSFLHSEVVGYVIPRLA